MASRERNVPSNHIRFELADEFRLAIAVIQRRCPLSFDDDERWLSLVDTCFARVKYFHNNVYYCKPLDRHQGYPSVTSLDVGQEKIEFASHEPNIRNLDARNLHLRVNG